MWQTERAQALGLQIVATGELLINVLCQLDQRTLLCSAVRVCHRWNDLIGTSADIRRRHFLSPVPEVDASLPSKLDWDDSNDSDGDDNKTPPQVRLNALLTEIFRPFFTPSNGPVLNAFSNIFSCSPDWNGGGAANTPDESAAKELVNMLQSAALQLAGAGEWRGVDAVLRLFKLNTSWALSANQVRRLDFMRQFSFPEAEAEVEAVDVV
ncbi:hypothetical protein MAPG_02841 [Magnaporthiopsis poae ATCC 64411]|uniref:F-box domain-containing protein n=1 Tax=Magnaporthiopsis poae (strain ATCC 64411 / 73-15) TaxID=644358 RepID=A0A0C4DSG2_MAGP6|nr:hypothetical protein MAPG_02841 [Magnaporthiopsis poae ATCC 64411]